MRPVPRSLVLLLSAVTGMVALVPQPVPAQTIGDPGEGEEVFLLNLTDEFFPPGTFGPAGPTEPYAGAERRAPDGRRWGYELSVRSGYSSNVSREPDQAIETVSEELRGGAAAIFGQTLDIWGHVAGDRSGGITARGSVTGFQNHESTRFSHTEVDVRVEGHRGAGPWRLTSSAGYTALVVDNAHVANVPNGRAGVELRETDWTATTVTYTFAYRDFSFRVSSPEDRDGPLHVLNVEQTATFPFFGRQGRASLVAHAGAEETDGAASENDFWGVGTQGRLPVMDQLTFHGGIRYRERDFENASFRSGSGDERDDESLTFNALANWEAAPAIDVNLGWRRRDSESNLPGFFAYEENRLFLELSVTGP